jgi:hypothetical protein
MDSITPNHRHCSSIWRACCAGTPLSARERQPWTGEGRCPGEPAPARSVCEGVSFFVSEGIGTETDFRVGGCTGKSRHTDAPEIGSGSGKRTHHSLTLFLTPEHPHPHTPPQGSARRPPKPNSELKCTNPLHHCRILCWGFLARRPFRLKEYFDFWLHSTAVVNFLLVSFHRPLKRRTKTHKGVGQLSFVTVY